LPRQHDSHAAVIIFAISISIFASIPPRSHCRHFHAAAAAADEHMMPPPRESRFRRYAAAAAVDAELD